MDKDPELHTFASGTHRFESTPLPTLSSALTTLGKKLRERRYKRNEAQLKAGKLLSDRIMGELDDAQSS